MARFSNNRIIGKFLSNELTEKLLLLITVVLILLSSAYLVRKSLALHFEQYQQYRNAIIELRELDSTFNKEILKSRYELFADYDLLVRSLEGQKQITNKLDDIPNLGISAPNSAIEPILAEIRTLLENRDNLSERFKSRNALLKNSLRYLPLLTSQLEENFATQAQENILTRDQISELRSTLNSLLRNLLLYNIAVEENLTLKISALIEKLDQIDLRYELTQEQFPTELVKSHTNIILNTKPQVEQLTNQLLQPLDQYTKNLETTIDRSYQEAAQQANLYRILTCIWFIMLLIFVNYFLFQRLRQINPDLSSYKKQIAKLTAIFTEIFQQQQTLAPGENFSSVTSNSNHHFSLPIAATAESDNPNSKSGTNLARLNSSRNLPQEKTRREPLTSSSLVPLSANSAVNSESELIDLADRSDELGNLARHVKDIALQKAIEEQITAEQKSFASLIACLTLTTNQRRKMISPQTLEVLKNIFNNALAEWDCQLIAMQGSLEQVEIIFSYPPQIQLLQLVAHLKAASSSYLEQNLGDIIDNLESESQIWSNSYSLQSCETVISP